MNFTSITQKVCLTIHSILIWIGLFVLITKPSNVIIGWEVINGFFIIRLLGLIPLGDYGYENVFLKKGGKGNQT